MSHHATMRFMTKQLQRCTLWPRGPKRCDNQKLYPRLLDSIASPVFSDTRCCNVASALFHVARADAPLHASEGQREDPMDKAKPLTGVFAFIILSSFSKYAYSGDGTSFDFKNNTSQEYVLHYAGANWLTQNKWIINGRQFKDAKHIGIPPGKTQNFYVELDCRTGGDPDAVANWNVHRSDNEKTGLSEFRLEIPNDGEGRCKARKFLVNKQYRKIELVSIPLNANPPSRTPTPHFRFTIVDNFIQGSVVFEQEGPQAKPF